MARAVITEEPDAEAGFDAPLNGPVQRQSTAVELRGTTDSSLSMGGDIRDAGPGLAILLVVAAMWFFFKSFFARLMTVVFAGLAFGWYTLIWLDDNQNSRKKSSDEAMLEEELGPAAKKEKSSWQSFKKMIDEKEKARRDKSKKAAGEAEPDSEESED